MRGLLASCLILAGAASGRGADDFYLKDGDTVVFYGDSITEQRLYTTYVEQYVVTRFPARRIRFVHSGVGGDRVSGGWAGDLDTRLRRDVVAHRPTVVTVMLGMNDGRYQAFDPAVEDEYERGYRRLVSSLKKALPGVRLTFIEPSPFDDVARSPDFPGGYNAVLLRFAEFVRRLGREEGALTADLNGPVVAGVTRLNAFNTQLAQMVLPDRVHPGPIGHLLMAAALLQAWKAPARVSAVEIDAVHAAVLKAEATEVTGLAASAQGASWTQLDSGLPLWMRPGQAEFDVAGLAGRPLVELLGQMPLVVTGLAPGAYALKIDGEKVLTAQSTELATGVDLGGLDTPMFHQAQRVSWDVEPKNDARAMIFRLLVDRPDDPATLTTTSGLQAFEERTVAARLKKAQPKPHRFEIAPVTP